MNSTRKSLVIIVILTGCMHAGWGQSTKKVTKTVQTHRGTIVTNMHAKVDRKAHLPYADLPKWGSVFAALPDGVGIATNGIDSLYYKNGIYYSKKGKGFVITKPAAGIRIHGLPFGYRTAFAKAKPYFYYYGVFYQQAGNSDYYEIVEAPEEAVVDAIPDGYEIKKIENEEYYFLAGVYYGEIDAPALKNKIGYEVVTIIDAY
jgi:uncharacterized protein DUF6515